MPRFKGGHPETWNKAVMRKTRILIADDSAVVRSILKTVLSREADFEVVGEASNGIRAVHLNRELDPDVIIMDVKMPVMDGLEATRKIMSEKPAPILVFSSFVDAEISFEATVNGAVDVVGKPGVHMIEEKDFRHELLDKIRAVGKAGVRPAMPTGHENIESIQPETAFEIMVMGASTGGPMAVLEVLGGLPEDFPIGTALVQHLEAGFDHGYARWLDDNTKLRVTLAREPGVIPPGEVWVAPVGLHLKAAKGRFTLRDGPRVMNQRPSVDILFESAANAFKNRVLGIQLTGMGRDGAKGCASITSEGGYTVVQDRETSAVFGMPGAAVAMGGASIVLPVQQIAPHILKLVGKSE